MNENLVALTAMICIAGFVLIAFVSIVALTMYFSKKKLNAGLKSNIETRQGLASFEVDLSSTEEKNAKKEQ